MQRRQLKVDSSCWCCCCCSARHPPSITHSLRRPGASAYSSSTAEREGVNQDTLTEMTAPSSVSSRRRVNRSRHCTSSFDLTLAAAASSHVYYNRHSSGACNHTYLSSLYSHRAAACVSTARGCTRLTYNVAERQHVRPTEFATKTTVTRINNA